ncbi:BlaI/MecI/CopY family transcriptional regulator [Sediminibacterium ginsengisoli]|uniref:Predicted transcriptional regulator n=1 Tax=Sediminibacterium ginsengisoli TaxID=413434 RepID=A0A1T4JX12_9BACT|nr:BlaI/MecI/CopY family transcriptional regulator [Sediminibacterium ginsengisoli]SJZ34792.1 Predicted transcriptional regulator [Sediminibacterium ginsengisoli]
MEKLTKQEEEAMQAVWKNGEGHIKAFLALMPAAVPYTTLASTIKNLEKKGFLSSRMIGNVNVYQPSISREAYTRHCMKRFAADYFANSYKEMVSFFIKEKEVSPEELRRMIDMIENDSEPKQ